MKDNTFYYLYVLDYSYPGIYEIKLTEEDQKLTSNEILEKYGLKETNCHFMYTKDKLELEILNK